MAYEENTQRGAYGIIPSAETCPLTTDEIRDDLCAACWWGECLYEEEEDMSGPWEESVGGRMRSKFMEYQNTDREIWRETPGDYYSPSLHVTKEGSIGLNVKGHVFVLSPEQWHKAAKLYRKWQQVRDSRWYKLGEWLGIYPRISTL